MSTIMPNVAYCVYYQKVKSMNIGIAKQIYINLLVLSLNKSQRGIEPKLSKVVVVGTVRNCADNIVRNYNGGF